MRIHTFGYSADWGSNKESHLSIHDFGQALLGELANSPIICGSDQHTAVVLIGHSMGGIVIKKALLLAKQDPNCLELYPRIHSMFFIATPHRGADGAILLKKMLHLTGQKAYVDELRPGSTSTQVINDEFRHAYGNVQLYSFFETLPMSHLGIVVDRESAILGLPGERIQLLNADHRHVCKFADKSDSNFSSLRNAFVSVIDSIEKSWLSNKRNAHLSQLQALSQYLDITEKPAAVLATVTQRQTEGTCVWLDANQDFQRWVRLESDERVFYLEGEPASGKSTVAGHVIRSLECSGVECVFFFFRHGDTTQSMAATLLRSFAWQMAAINTDFRAELLHMAEQNHFFDKNDEGSVWRNIFVARILKLQWHQPCFWVIDALDECVNYATLFPLFSKIEQYHPLRIFITGRPLLAIDRLFAREKLPRLDLVMSITDSLEDIKLFLKTNVDFLPAEDENEREMLLRRILNRSNGNFLWTSLVLQELADTPSVQQAYEVLDSVPNGMDDLYSRILDALMANYRNRNIARAILSWVVCAMRPLSVEELKGALDLDINVTLPRLGQTIASLTGNLVFVDASNKVQLVHQTVRAFLTREGAITDAQKAFGIVRHRDHLHISNVCIEYLSGPEFQTPRYRRSSLSGRAVKRSAFATYAITHFSDHVVRSFAEDEALLKAMQRFLNTNSLTWIEVVASSGDLSPIARAASNLRSYLKRRAQTLPPLGQSIEDITAWSSDLARLVASFGKAILMSPTAIQFLIPPVCPTHSAVFRHFAQYPQALRFFGSSSTEWDDRVSCVVYPNLQVLSVASHDNSFAAGLSDGTARVLSLSTTQEQRSFKHNEQVRHVRFSATDQHLVTGSRKRVCTWDLASGSKRWERLLESPILCVEFTADSTLVFALTNTNVISMWNATTGALTQQFNICDMDEQTGQEHLQKRVATHADFCPGLNLLAVGYRQRPVVIWELVGDECDYLGSYTKNSKTYPGPLLFALKSNPKPEIALVAASYDDGDLVVFDPFVQRTRASIPEMVARMHATNDGRTLVTSNGSGRILLFEFDTLQRLYCIDSYEMVVRDFAFSSDSETMLEVRGNHCNMWKPPVLSRAAEVNNLTNSSIGDQQSITTTMVALESHDDGKMITAVFAPRDSILIFCGREDGSITAHSTDGGQMVSELAAHSQNVSVSFISANPTGKILASIDVSGRILIQSEASQQWQFDILTDEKLLGIVEQILIQEDGTKILISTEDRDEVRKLPGLEIIKTIARKGTNSARWAQHPFKSHHLLLVSSITLEVFEWQNLKQASGQVDGVAATIEPTPPILGVEIAIRCRRFCVIRGSSKANLLGRKLEVYDSAAINPEKLVISPLATYEDLATQDIKVLIGVHENSLLFLTHQGWVCSLDISGTAPEQTYIRHFFIPFKYHNSGGGVFIVVNSAGTVMLNFNSHVVMFENGLHFVEKVRLGTRSNTPGLSSTKLSMRSTLLRGHSAPAS